jgi:hypothetical protein
MLEADVYPRKRMGIGTMNLAQQDVKKRFGFEAVCSECGSLSIKIADPAHAPDDTKIECGRCAAVRGTLADLHVLARRSCDIFEF